MIELNIARMLQAPTELPLVDDFYDRMASLYHLIFQDWDESIERQGEQLAELIRERFGGQARTILDVSCGIGTQAIGLAKRGFIVTASDLSNGAIARARAEAERRSVEIDFSVCDMKAAYTHHRRQFDVVISADNSITHLLDDDDLEVALRQMLSMRPPGRRLPRFCPRLRPRRTGDRAGQDIRRPGRGRETIRHLPGLRFRRADLRLGDVLRGRRSRFRSGRNPRPADAI